ncbi:MAG TPA: IS1634 family transposase, partial [Thermoanaerobaculaceae bacterium]|nr:IS1634 family transposase [Thermoanaerobaculaceae bacterium]
MPRSGSVGDSHPQVIRPCRAYPKSAACAGGAWQNLGQLAAEKRPTSARYRASEQTANIDGRPYRLLVVYSDHLDQRKRKTFAKHLAKERVALEKDLVNLQKARFSCAADAETAAGTFLMGHASALHQITLDVVSLSRQLPYLRCGRPSHDQPVRSAQEFALSGQIGEPDSARIEEIHRLRACFVLITNLDPEAFPARRLLEEYRDQAAVEQRFRFVKDPMFIDALYLHTPRRIEALAYVFVMACLVYSVFERRVRAAL